MASYSITNDDITLSWLDTRLLVALVKGKNTPYALARQAELDMGPSSTITMSAVYTALKRLESVALVESIKHSAISGRPVYLYTQTALGRDLLKRRLGEMDQLIRLTKARL